MNISMSESDLKLNIISKITSISDKKILEEINKLVNLESELDSVYELSPEEKLAIEKGLKDVAEGRVYSSDDALKMLREWQDK
jgi:predicted transcriptional regulator